MTNDEIKEKLAIGDPYVMKWIFKQYYTGLCTYANRFTKNESISEEIVQHSFYKLWEKRKNIDVTDSLIGYLYQSVRNNCLNYLKHEQIVNRHKQNYYKELCQAEGMLKVSQENGLSIYIANELKDKINKIIDELPEQCREIFKMSRFEGLKHKEIAKKKEISLNTVQKQISIALGKIRSELSTYLSIIISLIIKFL